MSALLTLASTEGAEEASKTAFYIAGGVLAGWAVVLTAIGMSKPDFPGSVAVSRGLMAISAILVVAACAAAVATG
jgi:hypothetical protein